MKHRNTARNTAALNEAQPLKDKESFQKIIYSVQEK